MENDPSKVTEIKTDTKGNSQPVCSDPVQYKKDQIERLKKYRIGETDAFGYKISKVLSRGDEFVIYEVSELPPQESIKIKVDTILEIDQGPIKRLNEVKPYFDEFLSVLFKYGLDASYKKRAASAISMGITGDLDRAKELFKKIMDDAHKEHKEKLLGRLSYQSGSLSLALLFVSISTALYLNRDSDFVIDNYTLFYLFVAASFSSLGGFLSVSLKAKELIIDRGLRKIAYFMYGAERIFISVIGGVFIFTLIKGNLALGFLGEGEGNIYGVMSFCLLAGFSETLVPNALKNLEKTSNNSNK